MAMETPELIAQLRARLRVLDAQKIAIEKKLAPHEARADKLHEKAEAAMAEWRKEREAIVAMEKAEGLRELAMERGRIGKALGALNAGHAMEAEGMK